MIKCIQNQNKLFIGWFLESYFLKIWHTLKARQDAGVNIIQSPFKNLSVYFKIRLFKKKSYQIWWQKIIFLLMFAFYETWFPSYVLFKAENDLIVS